MTEQLVLANLLQQKTDSELASLVRVRKINLQRINDFFDLAKQFLNKKKIEPVIQSLSREQLLAIKTESNSELIDQLLFGADSKLFESMESLFAELEIPAEVEIPSVTASDVDRAAINAHYTLLAITEILVQVDSHPIRATARGVAVSDAKWIGRMLGWDPTDISHAFDLAAISELIQPIDGRWQLTENSERWQIQDAKQKLSWFLHAIASMDENLPLDLKPGQQIEAVIKNQYPLFKTPHPLNNFSNLLALAVDGFATELIQTLSTEGPEACAEEIASHLPKPVNQLIVQADLTMIAPGPIDYPTDRQIRLFAEPESVSLASNFRLTTTSVVHGMECGLTADDIKATLDRLSTTEIPQPVEYLLKDATEKFGSLTIISSAKGSIIEARDPAMLAQIKNQSELRAFHFVPITENQMLSKHDSDLLYFNIRSCGYPIIRIDEQSQVISPRKSPAKTIEAEDDLVEQIAKLRSSTPGDFTEAEMGINRQLELSLKNKVTVEVVVSTRDGSQVSFELLPTSLSAGRLRGKDMHAETERTLPVSKIVSVRMGEAQ
ncbi:MAG: helicase-associated domain-containing protein [Microbacteriaceae bacterium]|nr:helicase-associated domain-containing protein [Microbacteriaceae bacterium]MDR9444206.1 helicase-associated domain-containing protein [Microbacteriaceae bacterium]